MKEHETTSDVIAAMRDYSNTCNDGYHTDYGVVCTDMRNYADRLEAAIKRECAKIEADALEVGGIVEAAHRRELGDAAKLRDALMQIYDRVNSLDEDCGVDPVEIRDIARAALAEPARNCDKYSHDQALRIWSADSENPMNGCFDVWLYAPATEKEGDNDGQK